MYPSSLKQLPKICKCLVIQTNKRSFTQIFALKSRCILSVGNMVVYLLLVKYAPHGKEQDTQQEKEAASHWPP